MQMPVTTRSAGAAGESGGTARSSAVAAAPIAADQAKNRRGSMRSASPSPALTRQPITNPICTPLVSADCMNFDRWNSATSEGTIADAENQSAIAATWQIAMIVIDARFDAAKLNRPLLPGGCDLLLRELR